MGQQLLDVEDEYKGPQADGGRSARLSSCMRNEKLRGTAPRLGGLGAASPRGAAAHLLQTVVNAVLRLGCRCGGREQQEHIDNNLSISDVTTWTTRAARPRMAPAVRSKPSTSFSCRAMTHLFTSSRMWFSEEESGLYTKFLNHHHPLLHHPLHPHPLHPLHRSPLLDSPDTHRKSSMEVMSSTASVSTRTCFSHCSLNRSMLSWATLLLGLAARASAALITCNHPITAIKAPSDQH
ncbi:hypothetical protein EYF80_034576 [Liparis tanakae]|uniref:Uncharacterized protein n=1 Tax=Liparis tanakae TaxID=230148 RepID=A0A4Z2GR23_9TELE|nr:hypothetical protein EYF80_034576 [Liparis tanakae]